MRLTDFMGKEYGPGDTVVYAVTSGRCANLVVATVLDIYMVWFNCYTVGDRYGWEKLAEGESAPEGSRTETRIKVQPTRGSRWSQHRTTRAVTLTIPENIIRMEVPVEVPVQVP